MSQAHAAVQLREDRPQFIKYMGSKAKIIRDVVDSISVTYDGAGVCDLFAGSAILSAAIGRSVPIYSNDIQHYSGVLARMYLQCWCEPELPTGEELDAEAAKIVKKTRESLPGGLSYEEITTREQFFAAEQRNRALIDLKFRHRFHLFLKNYSGTWWSAEQCLWIDAYRQIADRYKARPAYDLILACLMHAMAYNSQGTGHYAQYRDGGDDSSIRDIMIYRTKSIRAYFVRKYDATMAWLPCEPPEFKHQVTSLDYVKRLKSLRPCTVYADPPYCFVHYSRFYHALETLVLYDFPGLQIKAGKLVKGRYRENRHQSPFCIHSEVYGAFRELFQGIAAARCNLVLSYSNTGMISLDELNDLAVDVLNGEYELDAETLDHRHMTMGRKKDHYRDVEECLIRARRR